MRVLASHHASGVPIKSRTIVVSAASLTVSNSGPKPGNHPIGLGLWFALVYSGRVVTAVTDKVGGFVGLHEAPERQHGGFVSGSIEHHHLLADRRIKVVGHRPFAGARYDVIAD